MPKDDAELRKLIKSIDRREGTPLAFNMGSPDQRELDRLWFENNPDRIYHVRAVSHDEFPPRLGTFQSVVLIRAGGGRSKHPAQFSMGEMVDDERFLCGFVHAVKDLPCPAEDSHTRNGWALGVLGQP